MLLRLSARSIRRFTASHSVSPPPSRFTSLSSFCTVSSMAGSNQKNEAYLSAVIPKRITLFEQIQADQLEKLKSLPHDPIKVTLPDGSVKEGKKWETTPMDIAAGISKGLANSALISSVNDELWDMSRPLEGDCKLELFKFDSDKGRDTLNCGFLGLQDTLWDVQGRHLFKNCYIEGAIDFIFGSGQSIYEDCHIHATAGVLASIVNFGYITAQARWSLKDPSGFVFVRGSVTGTMNVYLGRAYGPFSRVIFFQTDLASVVVPQGWFPWNYAGHESRFTYAEVECKGEGSHLSRRVPWINKDVSTLAKDQFATYSFIDQDGWLSSIPPF
ncbi:hypothetical protein F2Q69_00056203 [Brassica cretica]|uniref:Pectinesterase n=1 Tax=Brassica cretica TaxID=69181 RepID=A0A8S9MV37_BRACR|nr:hypothetical protein F2Q69_00056203 [Brassica cretica]